MPATVTGQQEGIPSSLLSNAATEEENIRKADQGGKSESGSEYADDSFARTKEQGDGGGDNDSDSDDGVWGEQILAHDEDVVSSSSHAQSDDVEEAEEIQVLKDEYTRRIEERGIETATPTIHLSSNRWQEDLADEKDNGPTAIHLSTAQNQNQNRAPSPSTNSSHSSLSRRKSLTLTLPLAGAEGDDFYSHASLRASNPFALDFNYRQGMGSAFPSPSLSGAGSVGSSVPGTPVPVPVPNPSFSIVDGKEGTGGLGVRKETFRWGGRMGLESYTRGVVGSKAGQRSGSNVGSESGDEGEDVRRVWEDRLDLELPPTKSTEHVRIPNPANMNVEQEDSLAAAKKRRRMTRSNTVGDVSIAGLASQLRVSLGAGMASRVADRMKGGWETTSLASSPDVPDIPRAYMRRVGVAEEAESGTGSGYRAEAEEDEDRAVGARRRTRRFSTPSVLPSGSRESLDRGRRVDQGRTSPDVNDAYDLGSPTSYEHHTYGSQSYLQPQYTTYASVTPVKPFDVERAAFQNTDADHERLKQAILSRQAPAMSKEGSSASSADSSAEIHHVIMTPSYFNMDRSHIQSGVNMTPTPASSSRTAEEITVDATTPKLVQKEQYPYPSPGSPWTLSPVPGSPKDTSIMATAMTKNHRGFTVHGKTDIDLTSAKNPVPIRFIVGDQSGFVGVGLGIDSLSSEGHGSAESENIAPRPKYASPPLAAAFFPKEEMTAPRSNFTNMEVPLPLHQSRSSQSLKDAYASPQAKGRVEPGSQEQEDPTSSPSVMLQLRSSLHKRSMSFKRGNKTPPSLRVDTSVQVTTPPVPALPPVSALRVSPILPNTPTWGSSSGPATPSNLPRPSHESSLLSRPSFQFAIGRNKMSSMASPVSASPSPISSKDMFRTERFNDTHFTMSDEVDQGGRIDFEAEEIDEWGFIGNSPIPAIFGAKKKDAQGISKLEQTMVSGNSYQCNSLAHP